jgi:large subunit ribosomal protein L9
MKLLLRDKVPGLGVPGEVVECSDGYGRNYLIPQRLAVPNTPENRRLIEGEKLQYLQREALRQERAEATFKQLKNALLQVHLKAQQDGSLYGSVNQQIVAQVVKQSRGLEIEERWVQLDEPIKKIGDYDLTLRMPGDKSVTFKLTVLPEEE